MSPKAICVECGNDKAIYSGGHCEECYAELFMLQEEDEEGFEIANEVAEIKEADPTIYLKASDLKGEIVFDNSLSIKKPKAYRLKRGNFTSEEIANLVFFWYGNAVIYEDAKYFDRIKHLLEEVE